MVSRGKKIVFFLNIIEPTFIYFYIRVYMLTNIDKMLYFQLIYRLKYLYRVIKILGRRKIIESFYKITLIKQYNIIFFVPRLYNFNSKQNE